MKTQNQNQPYIDLLLTDTRHKQFIQTALKLKDAYALKAIKNNTHRPIRLVYNWFFYGLMASNWDSSVDSDYVVIFTPLARLSFQQLGQGKTDHDDQDLLSPIAENAYDFLL